MKVKEGDRYTLTEPNGGIGEVEVKEITALHVRFRYAKSVHPKAAIGEIHPEVFEALVEIGYLRKKAEADE